MNLQKTLLLLLVVFAVLQALCFGPIFKHVGFYLDDWATLAILHFAPKEGGFFPMIFHYLMNDSRVLIRPLEVLHYGALYEFFKFDPLPWHISNLAFEVANSLLFYAILLRLTGRRSLSYLGALMLLLYPSHDAAHYWAIASSLILSLVFYFASLRASMKATDVLLAGDSAAWKKYQVIAYIMFMISLFNYENFLPFLTVSGLVSAFIAFRQNGDLKGAVRHALLAVAPLVVAGVLLVIYLKFIVPHVGKGYEHAAFIDAGLMLTVLGKGIGINLPHQALPFFWEQTQKALSAITSTEILRLVSLTAIAGLCGAGLVRCDKPLEPAAEETPAAADSLSAKTAPALLKPMDMCILGAFTVFISYTIFGVSHDYMPTYISMVNRINIASSVGVGMVIVSIFQWFELWTKNRRPVYIGVFGLCLAACTAFWTLTTWGLSRPWVVSWTTQKEVRDSVLSLKGKMDKDATILLVNCPRYVMWAPVFDGVWDFQNMVRILFDLPEFQANVVSERLSLTPAGITDVSYGFECGVYKFDKLYLMIAPHPEMIPARTPEAFIDTVAKRGMSFGLDKNMLSKWREQAGPAPKLEASH